MARKLVLAVLVLVCLAAGGYGWWLYGYSQRHVWTDDAHVESALVVISARVPGPVTRVLVQDNEHVTAGQPLVEIDPRDYEIRVQQARAAVAMAEARLRGVRAGVPLVREGFESRIQQMRAGRGAARVAVEAARMQILEVRARVEGRQAAIAAAQADVRVAETATEKTRMDLERMSQLMTRELVARQDHDGSRIAHQAAVAALEAVRRRLTRAEREAEEAAAELRTRQLAVAQAERRVEEADALLRQAESREAEVPVKEAEIAESAAAVAQARADLGAAELQLAKTTLRAPVDGSVSKKTVEPGQLVQSGQPLLSVVPLGSVWVVANFKETQLARVRQGLRATVKADTFPGRVFHGSVDSISAGTGARFSLLPPENASGNWVKVVQRIPVKIVLDEYRANPHILRPGMSATVTISLE